MVVESGLNSRYPTGVRRGVVIQERDDAALDKPQRTIARKVQPRHRFAHVTYTCSSGHEAASRVVIGCIVDHEDLSWP